VLLADCQTAGRGRRGRSWYSTPQDSLTFSLLWRFPAQSSAPAALSLAVGVALARGLENLGAAGVRLKWPNDVLHNERKLAGVLVELLPGEIRSAVIGIGLNLRLPPGLPDELARTALGLDKLIPPTPREVVLAALLGALAATLDTYASGGFRALRAQWLSRHAYQDRMVRVASDNDAEHGLCLGVDDEGALLLSTPSGARRIIGGEVSLRSA
jgi:BirA family biotin operon repressor/biotin-[acetyl-CoA-carboxylase] ligase